MKLGVVGKGGVGKTTVSALLARAFAARGRRVLAIDTDSNPNLGVSLGLDQQRTDTVPVLPRSLIVGSGGSGNSGGTATAADVVRDYGVATPSGVTLMSAIKVTDAGAGCTCAGHASVRSLLGEVMAEQAAVTLVDMEAGLEHLSRSGGTLAYADVLLVVMEPSRKSVITAARTQALAAELGIPLVFGVGNKARQDDEEFFSALCGEFDVPLLGVLPYDDTVSAADRAGVALGGVPRAVDALVDALEARSAVAS
ncbi:nucleotide-binding protein [Haloechinothrix halophila]|uniref:nucleotide-binding protein n=1 Tax=Haloechinothrix halophila TaxID=1069073 RepID=UPI000429DA1A|nr:AAA family ATPase [Haloechinothrix halophila]